MRRDRLSGPRSSVVVMVVVPLLLLTAIASASQLPFLPVETARAAPAPAVKRADGCLANFFSCADQGAGFAGVCCQNGQRCALDAGNQPACCPSGAVCTGIAPATFVAPTAAPTAASFVPNQYFSFPYISTSFANSAACSRAVSQCSRNYDACTAGLQQGQAGLGVTVVVGGATTVANNPGGAGGGGGNLAPSSATSICASLRSKACFDIKSESCTQTGGGFVVGNAGARPTPPACLGVMGAVAVGAGLGVMGQL